MLSPLYEKVRKSMELLDEQNLQHQTKVSKFADLISTQILGELLGNQIAQNTNVYNGLRNYILGLNQQLSELNHQTQIRSRKLAQLYHKSTQSSGNLPLRLTKPTFESSPFPERVQSLPSELLSSSRTR